MLIIRRLTSSGLLLLALAGCNGKDTDPDVRWRAVEPRLSIPTAWHPYKPILSGRSIAEAACGKDIVDDGAAREAVAMGSPCLDRAIEYLEKTSRRNAAALTDLAAAYYVRAQRKDRVSDLLRALNAAEGAAAVRPVPPGAHFNQGLTLESLGLNRQAIDAWTLAEKDEKGDWAREARAHRDALARSLSETGEHRWAQATERIEHALARNDEKAIEAIIAPFPFTAKRFFENALLPAWAKDPSPLSLDRLRIFATALSATTRDQYARDIVASIDRARSPVSLNDLREGSVTFERARVFERDFNVDAAARTYRAAAGLLKRGGSPLYLAAEVGLATAMLNQEGAIERKSLPLFREIERLARSYGYTRIEVSARSNAANALSRSDRLIESLAEYDEALVFYQRANDFEGLANIQARRAGDLRLLGQYEDALRAAVPYVRRAANIIDFASHHLLIGETADVATQIGCPRSAFALLNAEVQHFDDELRMTPPEDKDRVLAVESQIAIARENRAAAELQLGQYRQADSDLTQAVRLMQDHDPEGVSKQRALEAQLHEIRGTSQLQTDPKAAADELAKAAALDGDDYTSFRVAVLVEEAQALLRAGRRGEADEVIRTAVDQAAREAAGTLAERTLQKDPIWNGYFDRFRDAYDLLIRQFMEDGRPAEALAYNEQSHALEPLDLIVRSRFATPEVRELAAATPRALLPKIASQLPPDTYILEYRVLDDRTYAWVVSHDAAKFMKLLPARSEVERWTRALQEAAAARDPKAFAKNLLGPYDRLIGPVLAAVHLTPNTRLVIVPDEFMHALPFAALRDPNSGRYLVEQATVSVSGSAKLFIASLLRDRALRPTNRTTALLVGEPAFDSRYAPDAPPLNAARDEVQTLRSLYQPNVKELLSKEATVPRFLQAARQSEIVHIAAHAITDGEAPSQSFLLLTPTANDTGVLDAQRLLTALRLENTRLVVLGACRSGGSVTVGPQGVAPLVRPFMAAGVPGVIGTLWDINDATAKEVLVSFHRQYQLGNDAAAAMRVAQIEMLRTKNPGLRPELTWAAYQVIGYASSPFPSAGEMKKEKPPP